MVTLKRGCTGPYLSQRFFNYRAQKRTLPPKACRTNLHPRQHCFGDFGFAGSDIVVYAGDQVRIGLEKDDLFQRLQGDIERARAFYTQQVDPSLPDAERIFNFALVDVLVSANRRVNSPIW